MGDETLRSRAQIEAELASARARLTENLEALVSEVHPKAVYQRRLEDTKEFAANEFYTARRAAEDQIYDADGNLRVKRLALIGGAVVGAVALIVVAGALSKQRKQRRLAELRDDRELRELLQLRRERDRSA